MKEKLLPYVLGYLFAACFWLGWFVRGRVEDHEEQPIPFIIQMTYVVSGVVGAALWPLMLLVLFFIGFTRKPK